MIFGKDETRVEFVLNTGAKERNKVLFDYLYDRRDQLQKSFGAPFEWRRLDDKKVSLVVFRQPFDGYERANWSEMTA